MTVHTEVPTDTLTVLGADASWVRCHIFSMQDQAEVALDVGEPANGSTVADGAAVGDAQDVPAFAWKGETIPEYRWCTNKEWVRPEGSGPDLLVADSGEDAIDPTGATSTGRRACSPRSSRTGSGAVAPSSACCTTCARSQTGLRHPWRLRGDDDRCAPDLRVDAPRLPRCSRRQRQRLGHAGQRVSEPIRRARFGTR